MFLFGIVVGAVAMLGLSVLLAGARRTAGRGRDARHELKRSQRETAFLNQDRDQRLEHQQVGAASGSPVNSEGATTGRNRVPLLGRWSRVDNRRAPRTLTDAGRQRTPVDSSARSRGLSSPKTKESAMSIGKKIAHKAEAAKGAAKKYFGRATGNTRLRTEGRVDQFKGNTKQAGAKVKDAFKH